MTIRVYDSLLNRPSFADIAREWMLKGIKACIKELFGVWLASPRINPATGLSTYHGEGIGIPPETEASHFDHILEPFAKKHNITIIEFIEKYQSGEIKEPYLDEYFVHDRSGK
jgi:alpha,alpha-trehalase